MPLDHFEYVTEQLTQAKQAVERMQENQTGVAEAQQHVKIAEEALNELIHDPDLNSKTDQKEIQRASDLLRLIVETYQASN
ncbi:hypothetical protein SAMN05216353_101246 [Halobacillus alkaliphilus]|uniref:Uncharacterized protein n=1 Tax=Halobacillus alkaliphilus TaxID=396056 RepID=A0A1I2JKW9_9BACI|nr:hypothetical protein [Halobacillus alkaliphilus]SFF54909.1 hypothetical protein SAMN05216353_101246 [Halobacillus alkaliphilus]